MAYDESYFIARESWRDWRIEARALIDLARVVREARVLEIGCGGGGLIQMLRARGAIAIGIDTLAVALHLARNREGENVSHSPTLPLSRASALVQIAEDGKLPFQSATFGALIAQHVVEHIDDLDAALREWQRVLKRGGRLALATPNARYPDPGHFADADHARVFTPDELRAACERAGFRVESCITIFPFLTRARVARAFGVIAYRAFARAPYFASRGRTILLGARRIE